MLDLDFIDAEIVFAIREVFFDINQEAFAHLYLGEGRFKERQFLIISQKAMTVTPHSS